MIPPSASSSSLALSRACVGAAFLFAAVVAGTVVRDCFLDDAFIGFRYVENLVSGRGLVFNPGERVEGITNIGWALVLAPLSAAMPATGVAKWLGLGFLFAALHLCEVVARPERDREAFGASFAFLPLLVVSHWDFLYFSLAGMETAALAATLLALALALGAARTPWAAPFLGAFAFTLHPEAVLAYPIAVAWAALADRSRLRFYKGPIALYLLLLAAVAAARFAYYGALLPNTFAAKSRDFADISASVASSLGQLNVNLPFPFGGVWGLGLMLLGAFSGEAADRARRSGIVAAAATGVLFAVYAAPDWTERGRYFAPYTPAAWILLWLGALRILRALASLGAAAPRAMERAPAVVASALVVAGVGDLLAKNGVAYVETYPGFVIAGRNLVEPSKWMGENLPPGSTIACRRIGALAYHSRLPVFDYKFGLTDRAVARAIRAQGRVMNGPGDPALESLWRERAPDYYLEDFHKLYPMVLAARQSFERFEIHGVPYRFVRSFKIGHQVEWTLCERVRPGVEGGSP